MNFETEKVTGSYGSPSVCVVSKWESNVSLGVGISFGHLRTTFVQVIDVLTRSALAMGLYNG